MKSNKRTTAGHKQFRLRPIGRMRPAIYLFWSAVVLFAAVITVGALAIAGRAQTYVLLSSPPFALITIDGHGAGVAPYTVRLRPSTYTVDIAYGDYQETEQRTVERRSGRGQRLLLFQPAAAAREERDAAAVFAQQYQSIQSWSLTGVDQPRYQKPPVISAAVESLLVSAGPEAASRLLLLAARDVGSRSLLADWLRGATIAQSYPAPALGRELSGALRMATALLHANPRTVALLEELLGDDAAAAALRQSDWRQALIAQYRAGATDTIATISAPLVRETIANTQLVRIPAGRVSGALLPAPTAAADHPLAELTTLIQERGFYIGAAEVTIGEFRRFLADQPEWRPANRTALMAAGLVDENYLHALSTVRNDRLPITAVSWHAAAAYCRWLQEQLPDTLDDYLVRLPTEREWHYAALVSGAERQSGLFSDTAQQEAPTAATQTSGRAPTQLWGSVWEWNANIFQVSDGYFEHESAQALDIPVAVRPLAGGSRVTSGDAIGGLATAGLFSSATSQHIGFRPVIVPVK